MSLSHDRRVFLSLAAAGAAACGGELVAGSGGFPLAPWHMWGSSKMVEVRNTGFPPLVTTGQIARITYKRPETWSFFFVARLISAGESGVVGSPPTITVAFDLILGVGRASSDVADGALASAGFLQGFATFDFQWPLGSVAAPIGRVKWTSTVPSPALRDSQTPPVTERVSHFPAQDIQCNARVGFTGATLTDDMARVELAAYFAPRTHIRPEWYSDEADQFRGKETGGT